MKYMDIKPAPNTELGVWRAWRDNVAAKFLSANGKKIEVKQVKDVGCSGQGRKYCEEQGEHSWFNHTMDSNYGDLPMGFIEW